MSNGIAEGMINELQVNIAGQQSGTDLPIQAGIRALRAGLQQRYRGRITTARAFEGGTGREATYEVRPGDLVRIRDFTTDGRSLTLRISDVQYSAQGIVMGIEAPAIPIAALSAYVGGYKPNVFRRGGGGSGGVGSVLLNTQGQPTYLPVGSPGGPAPTNPGGGLINPDIFTNPQNH